MKTLILFILVGIFVGHTTHRLRWREIAVIGGVVALAVGWETANIVFRYIGVE